MSRGRLYAGTSGYSYASWIPRFYTPGKASRKLLPAYAARLPAVELNNTFYRRPSDSAIAGWLAATPPHFRFCPKAQRGTSWRAWSDEDPRESIEWLTDSLEPFDERLGCVLLSTRASMERDDAALERLLRAWPANVPLALELPHPSWDDDAVHARLRAFSTTLVASDWDERDEPDLRRTGRFIYVRLRRASYSEDDIVRWAARLEPFLAEGFDAFVFFRHDDDGSSALRAESLLRVAGSIAGS